MKMQFRIIPNDFGVGPAPHSDPELNRMWDLKTDNKINIFSVCFKQIAHNIADRQQTQILNNFDLLISGVAFKQKISGPDCLI